MNKIFLMFFLVVAFYGCTHQANKVTTSQSVVHTMLDAAQAKDAFVKCDVNYFKKLNNEDYKILKRERTFDSLWEDFLKGSVNESKLVRPTCLQVLKAFHKYHLNFYQPYAVHIVLSANSEDLLNKIIDLKIIPDVIVSAADKQLSYLSIHSSDQNVSASSYDLNKILVDHFLNKVSKSKNNLQVPLELYKVGETYNFCGLSDKTSAFDSDKKNLSPVEFVSCNSFSYSDKGANLIYANVVEMDKDWLKLESQHKVVKNDRDNDNFMWGGAVYIRRSDVTSPFVLSDGVLMIPIPLNAFSKIILTKENFYLENEEPFSCDLSYKYVEPSIEIQKEEMLNSLEAKKYELPKGFDTEKAILIKNVNVQDDGVCGC